MGTKHLPPRLIWGLAVCGILLITTLLGLKIDLQTLQSVDFAKKLMGPSLEGIFGFDHRGMSVFLLLVYGARFSLVVATAVVSVSLVMGVIYGTLAGWLGGRVDFVMMRCLDVLYAFPGFLIALTLVALLGPAVENVILAMSLTGWTGFARLVRGEVLHLKEREFVQTSVALGAPDLHTVARHVLPNLSSVLMVQCSFALAGAILTESSLSFLGLGVSPETPTWGGLLNFGRQYLLEAPHLSFFPGVAIMVVVLGFNFLGDGLKEFFDRSQKRRSS